MSVFFPLPIYWQREVFSLGNFPDRPTPPSLKTDCINTSACKRPDQVGSLLLQSPMASCWHSLEGLPPQVAVSSTSSLPLEQDAVLTGCRRLHCPHWRTRCSCPWQRAAQGTECCWRDGVDFLVGARAAGLGFGPSHARGPVSSAFPVLRRPQSLASYLLSCPLQVPFRRWR